MAELDRYLDQLIDPNERERMLKEGYLPEVIDYHARERGEKMQAEFRWKDGILKSYFDPSPYFSFVADVFPGVERLMVVTSEDTYREMDVDELMEYQAGRSDVYVAPATFIQGCYSNATCQDIYALVVDIDRIHPETLEVIIKNGNLGRYIPMPTYIVNSGSGVHFYYVFEEPVPYYYRNRPILKKMYHNLCGITKQRILAKTDWHAITQPFRLPGSATKLGQLVTAWECGDKWSAGFLARRLAVDAEELDLRRRELLPQKEYQKRKKQWEEKASSRESPAKPKKRKKMPWKSSLAGKTSFYENCLRQCYEKTPEGTRYRSMMALTVVARKVEYPKEQLEKDLQELLVHYNEIGRYMSQKEITKALRMYNDNALKTWSKTLEEWFGWEFRRDEQRRREARKAKGRLRTQKEVWKIARFTRDMLYPEGEWRNKSGAPTKEQQVRAWRFEHPEGKPKDCIRDTGISKNTVYKWWNSYRV